MEHVEEITRFYVVPILLFFFFGFFVLLILARFFYNVRKKRIENAENKIIAFLIDNFTSGYSIEEIIANSKTFIKTIPFRRSWCKDAFIKELIILKNDLTNVDNEVLQLYKALELHKRSIKLINYYNVYNKRLGFFHFQELEYHEGLKYVTPYLKTGKMRLSSNRRKQKIISNAYITYLSLTNKPIDFFVNFPFKVLEADVHKIIDVLHHNKTKIPRNIEEWLKSKNDSIVRIGLKIMVYHNYNASPKLIINLFNAENKMVRLEAINSVAELYMVEAEEPLLELFTKETSNRNKKGISRALAIIGSEKTVNQFAEIITLDKTLNKELKLYMIKTIEEIDDNYFSLNQEVFDSEIILMRKHIQTHNALSI
ncbi:HEAT repeat domain-containing protein [Mesonia sp. K7]|uniref:HEAT repeat domain-containing protein n=1 Tax=Mesonia sp. K7 TaxID=2218606 RepID=UPI000DA72604|nr:HEAT repeat domain-containing protein [Mesonia sp. K7]PZD79471.1 hypothetical protein DNG35_00220 [Mesonia sp. K7]